MNIKTASFIIGLIAFLFAYTISVVLANVFRAWSAKKAGDETAEDLGFLSFNPFAHIDFVGFFMLAFLYAMGVFFGWGAYVPINPDNIKSRARLIFVFLSDVIAHFALALCGIIALITIFGMQVLFLTQYMVLNRSMSHLYLAYAYPDASSAVIALGFVLIACIYLNMLMGVFGLIIDGCHLSVILARGRERSDSLSYRQYPYNTILVPLLLIFFFSEGLRHIATTIIIYIGFIIAQLLGLG